ncbi:MAG: nucleotidyltransferase domain-containing protein [Candidatus Omnitrophota bacterium]
MIYPDYMQYEKLKKYFKKQSDIQCAILFGSVALGKTTPMSDIDIGVYFDNDVDKLSASDRQIDITCILMSLYHINRVDVVILNFADPFLRFQVVKTGQLIYAKDIKEFYRFKAVSFGRYQEIKPLYEQYNKIAEEKIRRNADGG